MHISYAHAVRGKFPDDFVGRERLREVFRLQSAMREEEEYWTSLLAIIELLQVGYGDVRRPGLDAVHRRLPAGLCRLRGARDLGRRRGRSRIGPGPALFRHRRGARAHGRFHPRLRRPTGWPPASVGDAVFARHVLGRTARRRTAHRRGERDVDDHPSRGRADCRRWTDIGALGRNVLLSHAPGISDEEVELIAARGASVVMCPSTTLKEGSGLGDRKLPELLAHGVAVALGCDSANSSNYLDGVRMMNAAALGFKDGRRDVACVPAEQALEMATLLGARAVGLGRRSARSKLARRPTWCCSTRVRAEWRSLLDPVNNLVYSADGRSVRDVVADGRVVVDDGRSTFADEAQVAERVQALGEELLARTGTRVNRGRWPIV